MSRALRCDRCGRFFERQLLGKDQAICATVTEDVNCTIKVGRPFHPEEIEVGREIRANLVDLCPDCLHSFGDWFNGHYNQEDKANQEFWGGGQR